MTRERRVVTFGDVFVDSLPGREIDPKVKVWTNGEDRVDPCMIDVAIEKITNLPKEVRFVSENTPKNLGDEINEVISSVPVTPAIEESIQVSVLKSWRGEDLIYTPEEKAARAAASLEEERWQIVNRQTTMGD